jgi:glutamine amidotransferase-like uncharacterized protein
MEEIRFTYVVNPRRPIKGIQDLPAIKGSRTIKLTKEEVLTCMACGPVYRRFANESIQERVTAANLDRLHNEKFISEREFNGGSKIPVVKSSDKLEVETTVEENPKKPIVVEKKVEKEPVPEVAAEEVKEEVVEETVVENNTENIEVKDEVESVETVEDTTEKEEVSSEEVVEADSSEEENEVDSDEQEEAKDNQQITVDYNSNRGKKKKHRN